MSRADGLEGLCDADPDRWSANVIKEANNGHE